MPRRHENDEFVAAILATDGLLETAIEWIRQNLGPEDVFGEAALLEHVRTAYNPTEVFDAIDMDSWALDMGYVVPE